MIEDKVVNLIERMKKLTRDDKLHWEQSNRESEFIYTFEKGKITIDNWYDYENEIPFIEFVIYNDNGAKTENLQFNHSDDSDYIIINDLYEIVYKKHIKADETLDGIMSELDCIEQHDSDDEIPF
jgi:hypothetical protein